MLEIFKDIQLNVMLVLSSICGLVALFVCFTSNLPRKRKMALVLNEVGAMFLLAFDRFAYIYRGNTSETGYVMVRVSNFMVFSMTIFVIFAFNIYLKDLFTDEQKKIPTPKALKIPDILFFIGETLIIISQLQGAPSASCSAYPR